MRRSPRRYAIAVVLVLLAVLAAVVPLAAASSSSPSPAGKPRIKTEEAGYFGSALVTRSISVFVYSNLGPRAGNRVTVCLKGGKCERAQGHNARLAWYQANFDTHPLRMGDPVTFTATASDVNGRAKVTVTKPLLCMHNSGSTPQT
jgi:hypothetical protein